MTPEQRARALFSIDDDGGMAMLYLGEIPLAHYDGPLRIADAEGRREDLVLVIAAAIHEAITSFEGAKRWKTE